MNTRPLAHLVDQLRSLILLALVATPTTAVFAQEPPQNFALHEVPRPLPEIAFNDNDGKPMSVASFRGKIILLNIWATWCGPCRREMPTLDRLQAELGGPLFEVVALSIDRAGLGVVKKFYDEVSVKNLAIYIDSSGKAAQQLGVLGLPATLLIDRDGRELGRLVGAAEWDTPEMVGFLRNRTEDMSGLPAPARRDQTWVDPGDRGQLAAERSSLDLPVTGNSM